MLRIFLPLYLILTIFIICFFLAVQFLPEILLSTRVADFDDRITRGTFHLIDDKLKGLTEEQKKNTIDQLQKQFSFPVRILEMGDPMVDQSAWEDIKKGKLHAPMIDDADYFIKKMNTSDTVIALTLEDSQSEISHREAQGTFHLVIEYLKQHPEEEWQKYLAELQPYFGIPLSLQRIREVKLEAKKQSLFEKGKIVALDEETNNYRYFGKIQDSQYALIAGPIKIPITAKLLLISVATALIVLLATALFLWVRPLWRSMNELSRTANDFGQGKLQTRADIRSKAALGNLAIQFNAMADRIGKLIIGHRELTNAVSHELRTPIARMRFGLDMLQTANHTDQKSQQRYIEGLNTDVDDLEDLVNELLHYARFEQANPLDDLQTVEIVPWLESIIENARGYAGDLKIDCIKKNIPADQTAHFSPRHMARVIHNLLRNASRYGKEKIKVTLQINGDEIMIYVDDDGSGIPQEDRNRVFEAFSRLDESRDRQSGGHGLGLAIAKKNIEAHKGEISISTSPSGGARFIISWPSKITP